MRDPDWNGPICYCGQQVAVFHQDCLALKRGEEENRESDV